MLRRSSLAAFRHGPLVTVIGMEAIIHVTSKVGRTMKPRTCPDEDAACKPFGAIVPVGSAAVGSSIIVAIRALRGDADFNADLSLYLGSADCETETGNSGQGDELKALHRLTST